MKTIQRRIEELEQKAVPGAEWHPPVTVLPETTPGEVRREYSSKVGAPVSAKDFAVLFPSLLKIVVTVYNPDGSVSTNPWIDHAETEPVDWGE